MKSETKFFFVEFNFIVGVNLTIGGSIIQGRADKSIYPHRGGMILSHFPSEIHPDPNPPQLMQSMICQVGVRKGFKEIKAGFSGRMLCHTAKLRVVITEILSVDKSPLPQPATTTTATTTTNADDKKVLRPGQVGTVRIVPWCVVHNEKGRTKNKPQGWLMERVPERTYCFDKKASCPQMSRFVIMNGLHLYLWGVVLEYNPSPKKGGQQIENNKGIASSYLSKSHHDFRSE